MTTSCVDLVCMYAYMYVCVCVCMHVCVYVGRCVSVYVCMYMCVCESMYGVTSYLLQLGATDSSLCVYIYVYNKRFMHFQKTSWKGPFG
jgi:hypothetical protein